MEQHININNPTRDALLNNGSIIVYAYRQLTQVFTPNMPIRVHCSNGTNFVAYLTTVIEPSKILDTDVYVLHIHKELLCANLGSPDPDGYHHAAPVPPAPVSQSQWREERINHLLRLITESPRDSSTECCNQRVDWMREAIEHIDYLSSRGPHVPYSRLKANIHQAKAAKPHQDQNQL